MRYLYTKPVQKIIEHFKLRSGWQHRVRHNLTVNQIFSNCDIFNSTSTDDTHVRKIKVLVRAVQQIYFLDRPRIGYSI